MIDEILRSPLIEQTGHNQEVSAEAQNASRFRLSSQEAVELSEKFGTPLYVLDEIHLRDRIRAYRSSFESSGIASDGNREIAFASKANSTLAVVAIAHREGCKIDVASEGELRAALRAGVPAADCHMHGNNKSREEIQFALKAGIGMIMIDHFGEIEMIAEAFLPEQMSTRFVLRLAPGVDPITHAKISTGQSDTKFGFNLLDGSAERALVRALEVGLPVVGFHCHVGSQLLDPEAQRAGGEILARFAGEMRHKHGFSTTYINVGGGLGVSYIDRDQPMAIHEYNRLINETLVSTLNEYGLSPRLAQEPGRSLVAESGVTLYRVGVVKTVPLVSGGSRTYVAVDGGLSDNPRPALYGSKYTVERVVPDSDGNVKTVTVSGRHCETDRLFEDISLPADIAAGDLLQVLCTGAYNASMASNYNRYPRPATVLRRTNGAFDLVQRRDTWDEMLAREYVPEDLE